MSKHTQLKWEWNKDNGETELVGLPAGMLVSIAKRTDQRLYVCFDPPAYPITEILKDDSSQYRIEKMATARVRFHLNVRMKKAFKEYSLIRRQCLETLKRLPK